MRTPLTYYGGKQRLARQIVPLMPKHRVYLEPFAGGAAILFAKPRAERETLNDLDGQIVRFWRALRDRPDELARAVALTPYSRSEWEMCRGGGRWRRPQPRDLENGADDVEVARQLVVSVDQSFSRSRHGWSPPSIRFDRRGRWQAGVWENLPLKLARAAERLSGVALECYDAIELIAKFDQPHTLIYCDPPYPHSARLAPNRMYAIDDEDGTLWPRLTEVLSCIEHAAVMVSGYAGEYLPGLGWREAPLCHTRSVTARHGSKLEAAPEVVWLSPRVPEVVPSLLDLIAMQKA
jgi:DNA adenine methylase